MPSTVNDQSAEPGLTLPDTLIVPFKVKVSCTAMKRTDPVVDAVLRVAPAAIVTFVN